MSAHDVARLQRRARADWVIFCECGALIPGSDPIVAHRDHQAHIVAEFSAESTGVEAA